MKTPVEHHRDIEMGRGKSRVHFVLEWPEPVLPEAADQLCKDIAASLAMYTKRLTPFPTHVHIGYQEPEPQPGETALMEEIHPRFHLQDFVCEDVFRHVLEDVLFYARHFPEIRHRVGVQSVTRSFLVNFSGPSGTGKTMVAEALAAELGRSLYVMNFANVESSLLGRTPKNITRAFSEIDPDASVLLLDEADAFVSRRIIDLRQGAEYALNTARGQIIREIDRFKGMIVLATNLFATYDPAILRRIKFNLLFELPGTAAVEEMFRRFLAQVDGLPSLDYGRLANLASGLSGGDIFNLAEIIVMKSLQKQKRGEAMLSAEDVETILTFYREKTRRPGVTQPAEST